MAARSQHIVDKHLLGLSPAQKESDADRVSAGGGFAASPRGQSKRRNESETRREPFVVSGELVLNHSRSRSPQRLVMSPNLDVNIEFRDEATSLRRSFKRLAMSSPVDISLVFKEESASLQSNGMSSNLSRPPQLAAGKSQAEVPQQSAEAPIWTQSQELAAWQEQREQTAKSLRSASALLEQVKGGKNQPQWQEKQVSQDPARNSAAEPRGCHVVPWQDQTTRGESILASPPTFSPMEARAALVCAQTPKTSGATRSSAGASQQKRGSMADIKAQLLESGLCGACEAIVQELVTSRQKQIQRAISSSTSYQNRPLRPPPPPPVGIMHGDAQAPGQSSAVVHSSSPTLSASESAEFQFPFADMWDATQVLMEDILEDGITPDQRASSIAHAEYAVTIQSVAHLPQADRFGKCDPYVSLTFFEQRYNTDVHKNCYDTSFDQTFVVFVHGANIQLAQQEPNDQRAIAAGLALKLECWDWDALGKNELIGTTHIPVRSLLEIGVDGIGNVHYTQEMIHDGEVVTGHDGQQTQLTITVAAVTDSAKIKQWTPPTLDETLQQADGRHAGGDDPARGVDPEDMDATVLQQKGTDYGSTRSVLKRMADGSMARMALGSQVNGSDEDNDDDMDGWLSQCGICIPRLSGGVRVLQSDESRRDEDASGPSQESLHSIRTVHDRTGQVHMTTEMRKAAGKRHSVVHADQVIKAPPLETDKDDTYWREDLEKFLETLTVNALVVLLVLIDVGNVLVSVITNEDTDLQQVISFVVLGLFLIELTLRQLAKGVRFYQNWLNIFDLIVIYASIVMTAVLFEMKKSAEDTQSDPTDSGGNGLDAARSTTTPLRIFGRVAMGMRVLRVLVQMRKVNELKGTVTEKLRTAVSQNKRRYTRHGFNLDLTYITDRIIAMSAPALGNVKTYRNDGHVVSRFLSLRHYASFFVFNLCDTYISSDGSVGQYHPQMFFNQMQRIPFEDHGPPLLVELIHFCREACKWLNANPAHVVNVHCKGGKGRTGVMISALLLWCGHRKCAMDAMELFTFRRTENYDREAGIDDGVVAVESSNPAKKGKTRQPNRGVDGPSQQRYVIYVEAMLYQGIQPFTASTLILRSLQFPTGAAQAHKAWYLSFTIKCQRTIVYDSVGAKTSAPAVFGGHGKPGGEMLTLPADVTLCEDTKIEMYRHKGGTQKDKGSRQLLWFVVFHPAFYQGKSEIVFAKKKIDMLHKDTKCNKADANFFLSLQLSLDAQDPVKSLEESTEQAFLDFGELRAIRAGDEILPDPHRSELALVISGLAECIIDEDTHHWEDQQAGAFHPCGNPISGLGERRLRQPIHTTLGPGHILGMPNFLKSRTSLPFRARTDVTIRVLSRSTPDRSPDSSETDTDYEDDSDGSVQADKRPLATVDAARAWPGAELEQEGRRAFVVKKKLNVLQHNWRCLQVECGLRELFNKSIPEVEEKSSTMAVFGRKIRGGDMMPLMPEWVHEERLLALTTVRKRLSFEDIAEVVFTAAPVQRFSDSASSILAAQPATGRNLKVTLRFQGKQKPYHLEFLRITDRDDFVALLRQHLAPNVFRQRVTSVTKPDTLNVIQNNHCEIAGVPVDKLPLLFRGMAHKLTLQLDRTRTECIRISRLKALSDTDSLMLVYDEREQLRLACIKKFVLPVTEKLVTAFKCFLTIEGTHKHQRMRVIVLSNFLVLDMAIFGPSIHGSSTMLRLDHVAGLQDDTFDHGGVSSHSFKLLVVKHRQGESEVQETVWKLAFSKAETCNHARETMSDFEWRARQLRDHMRERPSEDPVMKKIAAKCATYHHLVAGQELVEARNSDSMFLIKSGSVTEAHDKLTFRLLREGSCFGEANFVKGSISTQVSVHANSAAVVTELRRQLVVNLIERDASLGVRFWFTMCRVLNLGILESMESTFPGTWCQNKGSYEAENEGLASSTPRNGSVELSGREGSPGLRSRFSRQRNSFRSASPVRKGATNHNLSWKGISPLKKQSSKAGDKWLLSSPYRDRQSSAVSGGSSLSGPLPPSPLRAALD